MARIVCQLVILVVIYSALAVWPIIRSQQCCQLAFSFLLPKADYLFGAKRYENHLLLSSRLVMFC